jgi:GTP-binding protein HflX
MKNMDRVLIFSITEDTSEIRSLLDTLNISVIEEFLQKRSHPHRIGFLGPGKLKEIEGAIEKVDFDAIVVNGSLKPSQHHHLEMRFQKECFDRTGVILRIFSDHAHTPEAIDQVTLARLRYELPFLREWIHKAKSGDRPGFLGGGAYATDVYYEHAKTQARRIELNLAELSKQREVTRTKRHAKGYSLVSLAGYTNAGKSALFNRLCGASVEVDDRLFSTLSTTTRKVLRVPGNVLMVDTVGFIKDLPPDLVNAFNSTLEEIFFADLILLVLDASESINSIKSKLKTCMDILLPKIDDQSLIILANKSDSISEEERRRVSEEIQPLIGTYPFVIVSAKTEEGFDHLRKIISSLQKHTLQIEAVLPLTDASLSLLSRIRATCNVTEMFVGKKVEVTIRCKEEDGQRITGWLGKMGAMKIVMHHHTPSTSSESEEKISKGSEGGPLI